MIDLVTGKVRFSYANVFEPRANGEEEEKYSITLLIPKSDNDTYQKIMGGMNNTLKEAVASKFNGTAPANPKYPIYDGDGFRPSGEQFGEECKGHWVMTANSTERPEIVDANLNPIMSKSEFYSGCFGRVSLRFYAYNRNGNKGVGCGLNNIQKLEDGPSLTGKTSAADDFGAPVVQNVQNSYQQPVPQVSPTYNIDPITGQSMTNIYGVN